ncbi:MAG TPA: carbohydrate kinase family protein [Candidatus Paceibacterota bacterium]|nr:carbohydrate kinase family protein [Candidatus Paceibacterota bacterium]
MAKIIVSGSVAFDRIMDFDGLFSEHFVADKLHSINLSFQVDRLSVGFGGTAANVAYNLALLGEQPEIIATVGSDFGAYRAHLLLSGVEPSSIREVEGDLTASAFILTDRADNQIAAFHFGAGGHAYDIPIVTEGRALAIVSAGCIADMATLPAEYRRRGFKYLYDPGQALSALSADQLRDGISGAFMLFGTDYELGLIAQKTGWTENAMLEHVPTIVTTYGEKGSRILTRDGESKIGSTKATSAIDPTGAGDAYRGGFIKGMMLGLTLVQCGQFASTVAAYCVEMYGTQTQKFTLQEVAKRYADTYGEALPIH